ncbi:MAG TPA: glucose-6-phosphate isomerase [Nocardioidaceae bacterium]|nr:glucose-6-phosphate isomerase [Nocardioidaceae bacterium]
MRIALEVHTSSSYDDVLATLVADKVASRIGDQDPTLWGTAAEHEASIRLSWVGLPTSSRPLLAEIDALRAELWGEGVDRVVLSGMGGSSLAPLLISRTYDVPLVVLDSTDPQVVADALNGDLARTVVVISSKSGTTVEPDCHRRAFTAAFQAAGIEPGSRLVAVTDPGSPLATLANEQGFRRLFLADPHVGGRYSALTAFGLVPTGLAGVDVADLLDEAEEVVATLRADSPDNPALRLGAALAANPGRDKVVIADAGSGIVGFADWAEQLIAESTGKQGKGVLPVALESAAAPEIARPAGDLVAALLVGEVPPGKEWTAVPDTGGKPLVQVQGALGAQLLTWETAVAVAGRLIGINPFDQPDVESAKAAARGLLEQTPPPEPAVRTDAGIEVRGSAGLVDDVESLADAVQALLDAVPDNGYLAVMAYVDEHRDAVLHQVRATLSRRLNRPVTFGWGPRFLHSTGQYHKGGPAEGAFLQITCTEPTDVPIPGLPFTFATLIAAQAAGDAHVLAKLGRPVLRLHLTDPSAGVATLGDLLR